MDAQNRYFKGFACIELRHLSLDSMKHIEAHKISGATKSFEKFGCKNNEIEHCVPIIIDQTVLDIALSEAHLPPSALFNVGATSPRLRFPRTQNFTILYGNHRVRAAKEFLPADNRCWIVALFDPAIPSVERAKVLQGNHCRHHAPDGQALATILRERSQEVVDVWLENMSATRRRMFTRLKNVDEGRLRKKILELLRFRGLQLNSSGNWEHILRMRCYEETHSYLDAILNTWTYILGDDVLPDHLDESTVMALHLKFPAYSSHDCEAIKDLFSQKIVFPFVDDLRVRKSIACRVLNCRRIVTFQSLFEDFIYLGACLDGLTTLLPKQWRHGRESFQTAMRHNWKADHVQQTDHDPKSANFLNCYIDLWLSAQREFPSLSVGKASNLLKDKSPVDINGERDQIQQKGVQLAHRAYNHGFQTSRIEEIMQKHPFEIPQDGPEKGNPDISTHECALALKARSNRPHENDYYRNKPFLYPVHVFNTTRVERKTHATTFAIARDIIHCCWGSVASVERWVRQPPLDAPIMINTEHTPLTEKSRAMPEFREAESQKRKSGKTDVSGSHRDFEKYRQLVQQTPNPFWSTDDVQMSDPFPAARRNDYEGEGTPRADDATAHRFFFSEADGSANQILPVRPGIDVAHGDIANGSTAQRWDQNDETGTTNCESLTVAPLRWQVRRSLASSQAPSPSEYSNAWTSEVTEAEKHLKGEFDLFEDGSSQKNEFIADASTRRSETSEDLSDSHEPKKYENKSAMESHPRPMTSKDRILDMHCDTKIRAPTDNSHSDEYEPSEPGDEIIRKELGKSVVRVSPKKTVARMDSRVDDSDLQEQNASSSFKPLDLDKYRVKEDASDYLDSQPEQQNAGHSSNVKSAGDLAFKDRRMTEIPDGLGIVPGNLDQHEGNANLKRKRGVEEGWKDKTARREGRFRPQVF